MIRVTRPSVPIRMNAFGSKVDGAPLAVAARTFGSASGRPASRNPRPAAPPARRSWRRDIGSMSALLSGGRRFASRLLDGFADAEIGPAAADVPGQRLVDIGIGGRRDLRQQGGGGHDLAGLAVAALHDLEIEPRLLNPLAGGGGADSLDGRDRVPLRGAYRHHAGSPGH